VNAAKVLLLATALVGACARADRGAAGTGPTEAAAARVRRQYTSPELVPAAAYTWTAPDGTVFVLVDVESGVEGVVQARADLWMAGDGAVMRLARSDVMPEAATIGAFAFEDISGDGLPDLLGYVADSAGTAYPIFLPGARGMLVDALPEAAAGFRLTAQPEQPARVLAGPHGACAIQVWAEAPSPDSLPSGWRYLALQSGEHLGPPASAPPTCQ